MMNLEVWQAMLVWTALSLSLLVVVLGLTAIVLHIVTLIPRKRRTQQPLLGVVHPRGMKDE